MIEAPRSAHPLLAPLNEQQRAAVTHSTGPLLVLAGAGTGKTRVVVHRIAYLISAAIVQPEEILAVTFTNRAADEMRGRVAALLGEVASRLWIGTFHWAAHRLLRQYAAYRQLRSDFAVLTPQESVQVLRQVLQRFRSRADVSELPLYDVRDAISALRNGAEIEKSSLWSPHMSGLDIRAIEAAYRARLRAINALDLDDLILETVRLLEEQIEVAQRIHRRFRHVLVDEYQDSNRPQGRLLELLVGCSGNVTAVGDEDQAIYGWRQADVGNILRFPERFPGTTIVRLEQNYRSTGSILRAANALITNNTQRLGKTLFATGLAGTLPHIYAAGDETEEASYVVETVHQLIADGIDAEEIAVLYRLNAQSRVLEEALVRAGIPYQVRAGQRFYERPEVARVIDALRAIRSPSDDTAWTALLLRLPGLADRRLAALQHYTAAAGQPLSAILTAADLPVPTALRSRIRRLVHELAALQAQTDLVAVIETLSALLDNLLGPIGTTRLEREAAEANLAEFITVARQFVAQEKAGLAAFLDRLALAEPNSTGNGVQLMTLHAAKGLEFDAVVITGVEEGLLPYQRSRQPQRIPNLAVIEEERRLLYVGMTRARRRLYLTYTHVRSLFGQQWLTQASRFIDEIPAHLVEVQYAPATQNRDRLTRVAPNEQVRHARWGVGTVVAVDGVGRDTMVTIAFQDGSQRRLQLCYAPLRRVEEGAG